MGDGDSATFGQFHGQNTSLIEPAPAKPSPMEWNRDNQVALAEGVDGGTVHPSSQQRGKVGSVAMFEGENQLAGKIIVGEDGARSFKGRTTPGAIQAQGLIGDVNLKGQTTAFTKRGRDKGGVAPAVRTEAVCVRHDFATGTAPRR